MKARAPKRFEEQKVRDGQQAMRTYLNSAAADGIPHLRGYVLVFRKDRCVQKIAC